MPVNDPPKIVKGHCPQCGPARFADVVGHHSTRFNDDEANIWGRTDYRILKCRGCELPYFQTIEVFSEHTEHIRDPETGEWQEQMVEKVVHYPAPSKREPPEWASSLDLEDPALGSLFADIYGALNAELRVPAAVATRTAFDRASELLGVDPAIGFGEKLNELIIKGKISGDEKEALAVLTDAGSAAAHRGWRPKPQELDTLIAITESFLHRTFVVSRAAKKLKARIPEKQKRKSTKPKAVP